MGRVKDFYFDDMERKFNELLDQGMDVEEAYTKASDEAYAGLKDKMADLADLARLRQKDEG